MTAVYSYSLRQSTVYHFPCQSPTARKIGTHPYGPDLLTSATMRSRKDPFYLAAFYANMGMMTECREVLTTACDGLAPDELRTPYGVQVQVNLAHCLCVLGDMESLWKLYDRVVSQHDAYNYACNMMGRMLAYDMAAKGKLDDAARMFRERWTTLKNKVGVASYTALDHMAIVAWCLDSDAGSRELEDHLNGAFKEVIDAAESPEGLIDAVVYVHECFQGSAKRISTLFVRDVLPLQYSKLKERDGVTPMTSALLMTTVALLLMRIDDDGCTTKASQLLSEDARRFSQHESFVRVVRHLSSRQQAFQKPLELVRHVLAAINIVENKHIVPKTW